MSPLINKRKRNRNRERACGLTVVRCVCCAQNFVADLYESSRHRHGADEVQRHYEAFKQHSEKYFSQAKWPSANLIAEECADDELFLIFYNEMASRHLFTKQKRGVISLDDYIDSWHNYREIFDHVLSQRNETDTITLTPQWAYDIVQEFVYQFQGFCQYRAQAAGRKDDELEELRQQSDVWALPTVVQYLRSLISRGQVRAALKSRREQGSVAAGDESNVRFLLGYFSITELSRLFCLIGNYEDALEVLEPLSLGDRDELYTQVLVCNINVFYHTGVCFLMLRRYTDAIAVFGDLVALSSRVLKPGMVRALMSLPACLWSRRLTLAVVCCRRGLLSRRMCETLRW
jgi:translation initiation factor 3 subunit L